MILERTGIAAYFDAIVDGDSVTKAKPDPEVFRLGADRLHMPYETCVVFEDSQAGLEAAKAVNMFAIGLGMPENLPDADVVYRNLLELEVERFFPRDGEVGE